MIELTSALGMGIVGGVAGYVLPNFVGKPLLAYRELKKEIARCLVLYANADSVEQVDIPRAQEAERKFRELAGSLAGHVNDIPLCGLWSWVGLVPSQKDFESAQSDLIGLSNGLGVVGRQVENGRRCSRIKIALRIKGN